MKSDTTGIKLWRMAIDAFRRHRQYFEGYNEQITIYTTKTLRHASSTFTIFSVVSYKILLVRIKGISDILARFKPYEKHIIHTHIKHFFVQNFCALLNFVGKVLREISLNIKHILFSLELPTAQRHHKL